MTRHETSQALAVEGQRLLLLPELAALHVASRTLFVADLHLGKSATFRARGLPVPAGTTQDNLGRLSALVQRHDVARIVFLGDLLHSRHAQQASVVTPVHAWREAHAALQCVLVRGNHDSHAGGPRCWASRPRAHGPAPGRSRAKASRSRASSSAGVQRAVGGHAERLGEPHEVRVVQPGRDLPVPVRLPLDAAHVAERAVVEHHHDHGDAVQRGRRQLHRLVGEAAVARDAQDRTARARGLGAQRRAVAVAQVVLVAREEQAAAPAPGKAMRAAKPSLRDLIHQDAVRRQRRAHGAQEAHLRLQPRQALRQPGAVAGQLRPPGTGGPGCAPAGGPAGRAGPAAASAHDARTPAAGSVQALPGRCRAAPPACPRFGAPAGLSWAYSRVPTASTASASRPQAMPDRER